MRPRTLLLALLLGTSFAAVSGTARAQQNEAAMLTVAVAKPVERSWPETVPASGFLKPWQEAVVAAEIDGLRVTDVLVDIGSVVRKGQPVVRLAGESVRAELRKAEAALATAEADLAKAKANADRARGLKGSGALSEEKINEYLIAEKTALAEFESAEASVESQKIRLNQTTIVAPDDGLITTRSVQLGTVVSSGSELFRLLRQRRVEWQAEVPARYLACIRTGMPAKVVGDGGMLIDGTVRLVGPTVSTNTGRVMVYVALPASVHPPSGLYVTGEIELAVTTALTVPQTALVMRDGMTYVFTVEADRHVKRVRVETGRRNSDEVEILSDLDASANVVTTGGAFLSSGALVRLEGDAQ